MHKNCCDHTILCIKHNLLHKTNMYLILRCRVHLGNGHFLIKIETEFNDVPHENRRKKNKKLHQQCHWEISTVNLSVDLIRSLFFVLSLSVACFRCKCIYGLSSLITPVKSKVHWFSDLVAGETYSICLFRGAWGHNWMNRLLFINLKHIVLTMYVGIDFWSLHCLYIESAFRMCEFVRSNI